MLLIFIVKYTWVVPLKDKRGITIAIASSKSLNKFNRKPKKVWVHKGS